MDPYDAGGMPDMVDMVCKKRPNGLIDIPTCLIITMLTLLMEKEAIPTSCDHELSQLMMQIMAGATDCQECLDFVYESSQLRLLRRLAGFSANLPRVPEHPRDEGFVVMTPDLCGHPCLWLLGHWLT